MVLVTAAVWLQDVLGENSEDLAEQSEELELPSKKMGGKERRW